MVWISLGIFFKFRFKYYENLSELINFYSTESIRKPAVLIDSLK